MTSLSSLSKVYYKQNVLMEPLYNQWYAWSHLIAPANAAMCISNKHLKIMESFVGAPQFHVSACKQPEMMGGPFINLGPDRVPEIRELFENTVREHADMIGLAESIQSAEMMLLNEADGFSLEGMYARLPRRLRGYVELVYDLNNQPSMRLIEGLLYKSKYYKESAQSIALSLLDDDVRTFVLSTPRLADGRHLHIKTPFSSEQIDELFKMKSEPRPYGWVREALGVEESDDPLFSSFFTEETSTSADPFRGDGVRIRYFGHACLLIESKGTSILTDPVIGYRVENGIQRYSYSDLPARIDYVLITHNHQDHCMLESLLQLRHKVGQVVVPRSAGGSLVDIYLRLVL
ncbi:MAG: MBL fold metallo-hydrolase [Blastocatellia bacterium]